MRFFSRKASASASASASAADGGSRASRGTASAGKRQAAAIAAPDRNFQTPSTLELAEAPPWLGVGGGVGVGFGLGLGATHPPPRPKQAPWSQEAMAAQYGDRATARSTSDMLVLRPPSATLVLGKRRRPDTGLAASAAGASAAARATARAAAAQEPRRADAPGPAPRASAASSEPPLPRPPQLPSSPRDSGVIDGLLALLPPEVGGRGLGQP